MKNRIIIPVHGDLFLSLLRGDLYADREAVPRTAAFVGAYFNHQANAFDVVIEHESFAPVAEGAIYPRVHVTLHRMP